MRKVFKRFTVCILCLALCVGNILMLSAANENNTSEVTFEAKLDTPSMQTSDIAQTVVMRIIANTGVDVDGIGFTIMKDDALSIAGITGGDALGAYDSGATNIENGKAAWGAADSENVTGVTELAVVTFTVPANTPAGAYEVGFTELELTKDYGTVWEDSASATATLTITEAATAGGYTAGISADAVTVEEGMQVTIKVSAGHASLGAFNADEVELSYDKDKLALNGNASQLGSGQVTIDSTNGKLKIANYGDNRDFGEIYMLVFDTIATGTATVKLDLAAFVDKEGASETDLIPAVITPATVNLTINEAQVHVTFSEDLKDLIEGDTSVTEGSSYEFKVLDTYYTYEFSATMGNDSVSVTTTDGVNFIVDKVTDDLTIYLVKKTPKSYIVTYEGSGTEDVTNEAGSAAADTSATYNSPYVFKVNIAEGYGYRVSMTINGEAYTGYMVSTEGNVYTIPGAAITGSVVITVEKTLADATVSVTGDGVGIASGYATIAEIGKEYVLTVTPEAGYFYIITATMGGEAVVLTKNDAGTTYTTPLVTGNIVFQIEREVDTSSVQVSNKVSVNNGSVFAVRYETKLADDKVPTYNGNPMYWSENHQAYVYLTIAGTLSEDDAKTAIGIAEGKPMSVANTSDVNGSDKVDASDAQYVWNMYNAMYSEFTEVVTMVDFIRADRNADYAITISDAAYIINEILGSAIN